MRAEPSQAESAPAVRVGISACLLGREVRYDGGHKRDRLLVETLGRFVEWVPVCPEVEAGFGTPREPMRLVRSDGRLRLVTVTTGIDLTDRMDSFARRRVGELAHERLCGYVLKKDSPSCGNERVKTFGGRGRPSRSGRGLFATALHTALPLLPVEEEGRLADPRIRDNFVEQVFAYRRLLDLFAGRWTLRMLVEFHTAHKLTLMAHSVPAYEELGALVARAKSLERRELEARYSAGFMTSLETIATTRRHTNVLQHMAGYFKTLLDADSRMELQASIEDYRLGRVPLAAPLTLVRGHVKRHAVSYLAGQVYLEPHPEELIG
jgi:uncharacterized protein YbgA (DUF1722 family)/uncharacterized protein YbbK (DUF523 family)